MTRGNEANWGGVKDLSIEALFSASRFEVFRFEQLPVYQVPGEWELYQRFLRGERIAPEPAFQLFLAVIRAGVVGGRRHQLVRLKAPEGADYLRFEAELFYAPRVTSGEEIRFIESSVYDQLSLPIRPSDFFLFDDTYAFELKYDEDGKFLGESAVPESKLDEFRVVKAELWKHSTPTPRQ